MDSEKEQTIMSIILGSGNCRNSSMEAIGFAKEGDFEKAEEALNTASRDILEAHDLQTDLIRQEAGGTKIEPSLLMIHAQDQLMTSLAVKDLAQEFVDMYKRL